MSKEMEKTTYLMEDEKKTFTVKIADDVVASIAGLAAMEIEGVNCMAGNITNNLMTAVGVKNNPKGVKVEVVNRSVKVDMALIMEYGYNIPATCTKVQDKVQNAIENMTGLTVADVNIRIAGINVSKDR